jgi:hypothetical protein
MIDIIHSAFTCINHWRETRRVRRACRMSFAELETFYEYYKSNGGFSRLRETPTINQTTDGTARPVPLSDSPNIETITN